MGLPENRRVRVHEALLRDTWTEDASADNAVAEATHAAEADKRHFVTGVIVSHDDGSTPGDASVQFGGTEEFAVPGGGVHLLPVPLAVPENTAVSVELPASGSAGVVGRVTLIGFTVDSDEV